MDTKANLIPTLLSSENDHATIRDLIESLDNTSRYATLVARHSDIPMLRERLADSLATLLMVLGVNREEAPRREPRRTKAYPRVSTRKPERGYLTRA
jgi:hypothetical protein